MRDKVQDKIDTVIKFEIEHARKKPDLDGKLAKEVKLENESQIEELEFSADQVDESIISLGSVNID